MTIVDCSAGGVHFRMIATNEWETYRAATLMTKEPETVEWIVREFRVGDVFYDIGANIGLYTLLAAVHNPRGTVVAVEPMPANMARLCDNIVLNELTNVAPASLALSARPSIDELSLASLEPGSSMHSLGDGRMTESFGERVAMRLHVPTSTVDSLAQAVGVPNLIKIDVDGAEEGVLAGAASVLRNAALRSVLLETNWIGDSDPRERRLEPLLDCGFVVDCAGALYRRGEVSWQNTILSRRTNG